jgi:hypothetical protein
MNFKINFDDRAFYFIDVERELGEYIRDTRMYQVTLKDAIEEISRHPDYEHKFNLGYMQNDIIKRIITIKDIKRIVKLNEL